MIDRDRERTRDRNLDGGHWVDQPHSHVRDVAFNLACPNHKLCAEVEKGVCLCEAYGLGELQVMSGAV